MTEPKNVVTALAAVMEELPAIGKGSKASKEQGGDDPDNILLECVPCNLRREPQPQFSKEAS